MTNEKVDIAGLVRSVTQREWLLICMRLDADKETVTDQSQYLMPALAWLVLERKHGGQEFDGVLDMTDEQILEVLGIDPDADPDEIVADLGKAEATVTEPSASGASSEPPSASPPVSPTTTTTPAPTSI